MKDFSRRKQQSSCAIISRFPRSDSSKLICCACCRIVLLLRYLFSCSSPRSSQKDNNGGSGGSGGGGTGTAGAQEDSTDQAPPRSVVSCYAGVCSSLPLCQLQVQLALTSRMKSSRSLCLPGVVCVSLVRRRGGRALHEGPNCCRHIHVHAGLCQQVRSQHQSSTGGTGAFGPFYQK